MLKLTSLMVLSLSLVFIVQVSTQKQDNCYCIGPPSSLSPCQDNQCKTLNHYAENSTEIKDYSILYFLPGSHLMSGVMNLISHSNITLITYEFEHNSSYGLSNMARIECQGDSGFYFRTIHNLSIVGILLNNCGYRFDKYYYNAILMHYVTDLHMLHVEIHNTTGVGLYGYEIVGKSFISKTIVNNSKRDSSNSSPSGNMHFYYEYKNSYTTHNHSLTISDSNITNGNNSGWLYRSRPHAGGIYLYLQTTNAIQITLKNIKLSGNSGYNGGNIAFDYIAIGNSWLSTITVENCRFLNGFARSLGAGLFAAFIAIYNSTYSHHWNVPNNKAVLIVTDSHFINNTAEKVGAGAYIQLHEGNEYNMCAELLFKGCAFKKNNILTINGRGGSAVNIINFRIPDYMPHHLLQYNVSFKSCVFTENSARIINNYTVGSTAFYVEENVVTIITDSNFTQNYNCSGISAVESNLLLDGHIEISHNTAVNGGGIVLCENSILQLFPQVNITISNNHAFRYGGGIYIDDECSQAIPPCFFQPRDIDNYTHHTVHFLNNSAQIAGTAIYGGLVDHCYYYGPYSKDRRSVFNNIFQIHPNDTLSITSNPLRLCLCQMINDTYIPNCNIRHINRTVYSGGNIQLNVVVVGQRDGPVPGVVLAELSKKDYALKKLQDSQVIKNTTACTDINYTLYSNNANELVVINLFIQNSDVGIISEEDRNFEINVEVLPCPAGFFLSDKMCRCKPNLASLGSIDCNITTTSIARYSHSSKWWVGFKENETTMVFTRYCPFDYCVSKSIEINTTSISAGDIQCAHHRSGILCGHCEANLSMTLGSNVCQDCRDAGIVRIISLILALAIFGVVLVLIIGMLDINVSEGTLNAFVFFVNVARFNTDYFDNQRNSFITTKWLKSFVAFMSLDLGSDVCFYNGMTALGKTGLQFVFPMYLWCLAGLIIYFGRRSDKVVKLFGRNTVRVLATIIFLSYAKLIRTIIDIFHVSTLIDVDTAKVYRQVWSIDGNRRYLSSQSRDHTTLFVFAVIVAAVTLPYTLALLFIQYLRKRSDMRILFWVNKLKPFFDAYTGPYKDRYHFWTGFLLMMRLFLFVGIAVNKSKGPALNLSLITGVTAFLLLLMQPGIYKNWVLNIIEGFTFFNIIIFTAFTAYDTELIYSNDYPILICVGSMFLLFCGVLGYHVFIKLSVTNKWRHMKVWLLDKKWPWMKRKPIRSLILPYDPDNNDLSSSDDELDPILHNAPPVARYDQYREPLIETEENTYD